MGRIVGMFMSEFDDIIQALRAKQSPIKPTGVYEFKGRFYVRISINGTLQRVGTSYSTRSEAEAASIRARTDNPAMSQGVMRGSRMREASEDVCTGQGFIEALWDSISKCNTRTEVAYAVGFNSLTALNNYLDRRGITEEFERRWRGKK